MLADIQTVLWKERRAALHQQGGRARVLLTLLTPLVFAVLLPWQMGQDFFYDRVIPTAIAIIMPIVMIALTIPASFAGEREQHTLETLLASRLPDRAILFGKMGFGFLLGWGMGALVLLLGAVVVNLGHWNGSVSFFRWQDFLIYLSVSFLVSLVVAATGVLVSLKAPTVQDAAQQLMMIFLLPGILLQVVGIFFLDRLDEVIPRMNGDLILGGLLSVLLVLAIVTLLLAMARFQRAKLIDV
jgi:ABC-2 type transport system permease protein